MAIAGILRHAPPGRFVIEAFRESIRLLTTRRFGTFWFASLLSSLGTWAQQVAEPWLLLGLGASPFVVGLDSFAGDAPVWLLTLVGGMLADRTDRRRVISLFQSIQMLCPTAIVVLIVTGIVRPWTIVLLSAIVGVTDALSMPSFQSIVPSIVDHDQIDRGLALNATQFNLSRILGPAVAGVLMSSIGALACFVVSAVSYIPFIGVALWVLPPWTPPVAAPRRLHPFADLRGIVRQRALRRALLTVLATSVFCSPLITFTPVLVKDVFHGDAGRFSAAIASFGVGGLLGAVTLMSTAASIDRRRLSSAFALVYGAVLVLVASAPQYWALPPLLVAAGVAMTISNTSSNSLLQATANAGQLGQTVSLYMLAVRGGSSIGALLTGVEIGAFGVRRALLVNGIAALVFQGTIAIGSRDR
jgi:predicted MFS family arabinose efflux permease